MLILKHFKKSKETRKLLAGKKTVVKFLLKMGFLEPKNSKDEEFGRGII